MMWEVTYNSWSGEGNKEMQTASCVYIFCLQTFKACGLFSGEFLYKVLLVSHVQLSRWELKN